jgi:hypothetical protein
MKDRVVEQSVVKGCFGFPMGIRFLDREIGDYPEKVVVSTVDLEGAHSEDPLGICSPEHGFETAIFLDGCTLVSLFRKGYKTRREAVLGHKSVVRKLLSSKLPLAIEIRYNAWE